MLPCIVIGDSIAVGIAQDLTECRSQAYAGISASNFDKLYHTISPELTIISLGSNPGPEDLTHLRHLRNKITNKVIWLLPPARIRDIVKEVAAEHNDLIIDVLLSDATSRHIHPNRKGYAHLANLIRNK